jgi:hypothetical protein
MVKYFFSFAYMSFPYFPVVCFYQSRYNYFYLQIDVDIGSSSVARSIIGLVLGYVTSIVVDLAILIEV